MLVFVPPRVKKLSMAQKRKKFKIKAKEKGLPQLHNCCRE